MMRYRIDSLADGIFAIVMTLLVFDIRVPELGMYVSNEILWKAIVGLTPLFLSYLLSFSLLFTYWRAHHSIVSEYAKNINTTLANYNAIFFFFVALIPFSSQLLGTYRAYQTAILVFAANVVAIGLTLYFMRKYVRTSKNIETAEVSVPEDHRAYMRILFPVFCALIASIICFYNIQFALFLFTVGILFNLSKGSTHLIFKFINGFSGKEIG